MNITELIGKMLSRMNRAGFDDTLAGDTFRVLGAKYWKDLTSTAKFQYLSMYEKIMHDNPDADYHIGIVKRPDGTLDNSYQERLIGGVVRWIEKIGKYLSLEFKNAKSLNFPGDLVNNIEKSKSSYLYAKLLQSLALYQNNPDMDGSRRSRFNEDGTPKVVPYTQEAQSWCFQYYDLIAYGLEHLSGLEKKEQNDEIIAGVVSATNMGYPYFIQQSKDNIVKVWRKFQIDYLHITAFQDEEFITVNEVLDIVKSCKRKKLHFPYVLFYRTQIDKVRAVFGGHIVDKVLGAVWHAAKKFGLTRDACKQLNIPTHDEDYEYNENGELISKNIKCFPSRGGMPMMGQLPWEIMFKIIADKLPPFGEMMNEREIKDMYGYDIPKGDYKVDVIGEDFSRYDTTIIPEDVDFLRKHKKLGWLISYILDDLLYSEVWTGSFRVKDVYYKSGHPLTSELGSMVHIMRMFAYAASCEDVHILYFTPLSDDSVGAVIGVDFKHMKEWYEEYGLKIKPEDSSSYQRDHFIMYLKTLVGKLLVGSEISVMGEPMSKYLGLCHSEREITDKNVDSLIGVYDMDTGNVEFDMALSKIASMGPEAKPLIMEKFEITKETRFGQEIMMAIHKLKPNREYKLYRDDVAVGLSDPAWLATLTVLEQLLRDNVD